MTALPSSAQCEGTLLLSRPASSAGSEESDVASLARLRGDSLVRLFATSSGREDDTARDAGQTILRKDGLAGGGQKAGDQVSGRARLRPVLLFRRLARVPGCLGAPLSTDKRNGLTGVGER